MTTATATFFDVGIYSVPEAARLAGVSAERVRRWLSGYRSSLRKKSYSALWSPQLPDIKGQAALSFLDLIEVKFVCAFLDRGISWPMIHQVRQKAAKLYPGVTHPFCAKRFLTDGQRILAQVHRESGGDGMLLEIATDQHVFADATQPLVEGLEYKNGALRRWWPMGQEGKVAIDPRRNWGKPSIMPEGIPTGVLAESVARRRTLEETAAAYEISTDAVRAAVQYEESLDA